jgi:putative membrane protein
MQKEIVMPRYLIRYYAALLALCAPLAFAGDTVNADKGIGVTLNDAEVIQVLHVANAAEIKAAQNAKGKAKNAQVRDFAQQMITDHSAMDRKVKDLQQKLNLKPQDSALSTGLQAKANAAIATLKPLSGEAFDEAYILSQVSMHGDVIEAIRDSLLPSAKNAELKTLLQEAAPKIEMHLQHAQKLQENI